MPTPVNNIQPALVLNQSFALQGVYPGRDGGDGTQTVGMIRTFGFNFAVGHFADGATLSIAQHTAVFSLLGTNFGGDGYTTFGLPDLGGRVVIGAGQGPGLSDYVLGQMSGQSTLTVNANNLPNGALTVPMSNIQDSTVLHYGINPFGYFPSQDGYFSHGTIGEVVTYATNFAPNGVLECDGRLLSIAEYETLFAVIGTTYGGDGQTTFALPDLRGRTIVGTGNGYTLGEISGTESFTLTPGNLPPPSGSSLPIDNHQPSLAMTFLIALQGLFPGRDLSGGDNVEPFIGEIVTFAGGITPRGWARCEGQLLPIAQNQALFALLGTQYGGDGRSTFGLPDLRGRAIVGSDTDLSVGTVLGSSTITLTSANIPPVPNRPPVANAGSNTTNEDNAVNGNVTGSDADGNALTYALATGPAHGTLVLNPDGSYTYTPAANYHGGDSFTFFASDGTVVSTEATINLTVNSVNDAPTANASSKTTDEDGVINGSVSGSDVDGDSLTYSLWDFPQHGVLYFNSNGTYTYTPDANYHGTDSFTFRASDGTATSDLATVTLTVNPVNDAPTANASSGSTNEDTAVNGSVSGNDVDGDTLTYALGTGPAHGSLTLNADGTYLYTPDANYFGNDSFTFTASDGSLTSDAATVSLTVNPVNDGPTAGNDAATVLAGGPRTITLTRAALTANDFDIDGDTLVLTAAGAAAHGTVVLNDNGTVADKSDDYITYTPTVGFSGPDSFTYTVSDGHGGVASATVNLTVEAVPAPTSNYTYGTSRDDIIDKSATTTAQLVNGAAGNDTITGGTGADGLNGSGGNDILNGGKGADQLRGEAGADQFVLDKADMASGVDRILDFEGAGNGDVTGDDKIILTGFTGAATVSLVSHNGTAHTYRVTEGLFSATFVAVYAGNATLVAGDYILPPPGPVEYHSPVAGADSATVLAGGPRSIVLSTASLLLNDTDADADALTITGVNPAGNGTVVFSNNGTAGDTSDDYITYTPTVGYSGSDVFTYIVSDGITTALGTVNLTVQAATTTGTTYTSGGAGNDVINLSGATTAQLVSGQGGNDTITTGSAADGLNGYIGNDTLNGGTGKDTLTGGTGLDTFVFASADGDKITDFSVADDTIALSKAFFANVTEQNAVDHILLASQFFIGAAATTGDQRVIYNSTTGILWYDADGNGSGTAVQIAQMSKSLALTHDDFVVWA